MKVVGLLSGGKDSCFNLCHCVKNGHQVVALATLAPPEGKDELDSYMYQTVGHDAVHLVAEAMGLPLYRHVITGTAVNQSSEYSSRMPSTSVKSDAKDETEDLYELLLQVKQHHPDVEAVSVGAILSNYQRVRVEHVALLPDINLVPLTYLWQRDQAQLLDEMIAAGLEAVLIKVAGIGLDERDLGKSLAQMRAKLQRMHDRYGAHICGEGGEYETLTLSSPLSQKRVQLDNIEPVIHSDAAFASVSYLRVRTATLADHSPPSLQNLTIPPLLDHLSTVSTDALSLKEESDRGIFRAQTARSLPLEPPQVRLATDGWFAAVNVCGQHADSVTAEAESAFANLHDLLQSQSCSLEDINHINLYLSSQADFLTVNSVYKRHFGASPPSRACIALGPGLPVRILIEVIGRRPGADERQQDARRALHVQGRSYWAPANIGPYSQAVVSAQRITIAGQIGLRPADLSLRDDEDEQLLLSLQHARRILLAVLEQRAISAPGAHWIESGICWLDGGAQSEQVARKAHRLWRAQCDHDVLADLDWPQHERWHLEWAGASVRRPPPMCYVTLPPHSLPRGALAEWQLTAHTGVSSGTDADADDGDAEPLQASGERDGIQWENVTVQNGTGGSGLLFLNNGAELAADAVPADALLVKILATRDAGDVLLGHITNHCRTKLLSATVTVLPVLRIAHASPASPDRLVNAHAAIVWWE